MFSQLAWFRGGGVKNADAHQVFTSLRKLCDQGQLNTAFRLLELLDHHGSDVSTNMLYCLLQGCINNKDLLIGTKVQNLITKRRLQSSPYLGSHLIRLFVTCERLPEAQQVFGRLHQPNVFAWSEIIAAHAKLGDGKEAIRLYHLMRQLGSQADGHTFVAVLQACASLQDDNQGKLIHRHISERGLESNIFVACSLVSMYAQCDKLTDALGLFKRLPARTTVLWNALISGYAQQGHIDIVNELFKHMYSEGVHPNTETWNAVISGCAQKGRVNEVLKILQQMQEKGAKPNNVTWNGIISGLAHHGNGQDALRFFQQMQSQGLEPNHVTFMSILKACDSITALSQAELIHAQIIENSCGLDARTWNTVIYMYTRCGSLSEAHGVFDKMPKRGVEAWNSMIVGYAHHNKHELALSCFDHMRHEGVRPDLITYTSLLSACSHLGMVHEGCEYFTSMGEGHGMSPSPEHVNCMVDLLARSGSLTEAEDLFWTTPFCPGAEAWRSLLTHCRNHNEVVLGGQYYGSVVAMDDEDSAGYAPMSIHVLA